jgi:anti-sigma regulatory factor (Ser/Thr protein kinase)
MSDPAYVEDVGWFRIDANGTSGAARRAAVESGTRIGLTEARLGELAVAVAEMSSNLAKHADNGALLVRCLRDRGTGGVEVIALDSGPGMASTIVSGRDGYSTAGTLGIGLGAIDRLATNADGYSRPGRGTVLAVQFWPAGRPAEPFAAADGLTRPMTGEEVCGDAVAVRPSADGRLGLLACDGLGHGPLAALAAQAAVEAFRTAPDGPPAALIEVIHRQLGHTRGAAVAVASIDVAAGSVRYAGLGNISGQVVGDGYRHAMVSMPGIAGHQRRTVREFAYDLPPDAVVVLHSDGLTDRWTVADYPGLLRRRPVVIAATLLRDAGLRRDDASVLVATPR